MESLLNASGEYGIERTSNCRQQRHLFLYVSRQRAHDKNRNNYHYRTNRKQKLRPTPHGHEIQGGVSADEDQHLAEILQSKEGDERYQRHDDQRHYVTRARNAPVGLRQLLVSRGKNSCEADEERN